METVFAESEEQGDVEVRYADGEVVRFDRVHVFPLRGYRVGIIAGGKVTVLTDRLLWDLVSSDIQQHAWVMWDVLKQFPAADYERVKELFGVRAVFPWDAAYLKASAVLSTDGARPLCVLYCTSEADVCVGVRLRGDLGFPLTIRSTGHDFQGASAGDGSIVVDLSLMRGVHVDDHTITIQSGVTAG